MLFAHATGFCGKVWRPVRARLPEFSSTIWDFRGHGRSVASRERRSWWEMADDVLAIHATVTRGPGATRVVGAGHSMGGAALVMAELVNPGSFDALVLIEPILFGPPYLPANDHPLVSLALRRRAVFESRAGVEASYSSKPPFAAWDVDALAGYLDGGFIEDHGQVRLACQPTAEAAVFAASAVHAAWERIGEITIPVTILYGADTDTFEAGHAEVMGQRFANAVVESVPDTGHFLPMERPDVVAAAVRNRVFS
ncbi:MAG: alpha/beta hydrolase [Acidimicrobiia bacterium]